MSPGPHQTQHRNVWSSWLERLAALRNVPAVLRILWDSGRWFVTAGLIARFVSSALPLALLWVAKLIIDIVVHAVSSSQPVGPELWQLVVAEFALAAFAGFSVRMIDYLDTLLADRYVRFVSVKVMEHSATLDLQAYEDPLFYDHLERARVQATDRLVMIQQIGRLLQLVITSATLSISILLFSPWLLLLLVVVVVPAFLGETHFAFLGYAKNFRQTPTRRQLDYLRMTAGSKEAAKEVKLFGLNQFLTARFKQLSDEIYFENARLAKDKFLAGSLLSTVSTLGYYAAYAYIIYQAVQGRISIGTLTFLSGAILQASSNLQHIFSTLSGIADQALFLSDLLTFFRTQPTIRSKPNAVPAPRPIKQGFEFQNVSFSYPGNSDHLVLDSLSFQLEPGERVALVGENGQGKTTIVKLMTRLYDPTHGRILLDGVDLRDYELADLYREIGVIFQDFFRYEMTARENLAVGRIESASDLPALRMAAQKSLADRVIEKLPRRYDQMLGRRFDDGVDLSGGEWQKIALARAYLREAQLLILDEPTASLDARSEFEVFRRFAELTSGKMALFVSHRFSTVRMADRILVLANGNIAEEGSHAELAALGGRYAEMFEMQAARYR
jgi:ATP-binding cassette, subfamily B, bacterial